MLLAGEAAARGQPCLGTRSPLRQHQATAVPSLRRLGGDTAGSPVQMVTQGPPPRGSTAPV